jgi:plasmid stabilization system protein ParE
VKLVVSSPALADIERLRHFLADKNEAVAQRALLRLDEAIRTLESFPERGRPSAVSGLRELLVPFGQSCYVIRYAHLAGRDEVVILRIWHGREVRD